MLLNDTQNNPEKRKLLLVETRLVPRKTLSNTQAQGILPDAEEVSGKNQSHMHGTQELPRKHKTHSPCTQELPREQLSKHTT